MYMKKVLETLGEALTTKDSLISFYKDERDRLQAENEALRAELEKKGAEEE